MSDRSPADPSGSNGSGGRESITMHSSWRGIISNAIGSVLVVGGGVLAVAVAGWGVLPIVVLGVGVAFVLVVLFDYPVATTFTPAGVRRRMIARRQYLSWERVGQLTRSRPGVAAGFRKLAHGGLVAQAGRRRYLLVDQCESPDEFEALEEVLAARPEVVELVPRPTAASEPTWLYRRHKWAPERGSRR